MTDNGECLHKLQSVKAVAVALQMQMPVQPVQNAVEKGINSKCNAKGKGGKQISTIVVKSYWQFSNNCATVERKCLPVRQQAASAFLFATCKSLAIGVQVF